MSNDELHITPIKKFDDNDLIPSDIAFTKELLNKTKDKSFNPSEEVIKQNIKILFNGDFENQLKSICFFENILKNNDIVLPNEYLEFTLDIFNSHSSEKEVVDLLLAFYRHCTGFQSKMQTFLAETEIIDSIMPFFPLENVLAILGNLSLANKDIRYRLISTDILDEIAPLITNYHSEEENPFLSNQDPDDLKNFENSVDFLDSLIFDLKDFDFAPWISKFIEIFDILHSIYEYAPLRQAKIIIKAFLDYVYADTEFILSFYEKDQIRLFLDKDFTDTETSLPIIDLNLEIAEIHQYTTNIILLLITEYDILAADHMLTIGLFEWIGKQMFSISQTVVEKCFIILIEMTEKIEPNYTCPNKCIDNDFLILARDKFYSNITYRLKFTIYKFICTLFGYASIDKVPEIINEKALDLIVSNIDIIEDNEEVFPLVLKALEQLLYFSHIGMVEEEDGLDENDLAVYKAVQRSKKYDEFIDWLLRCRHVKYTSESDSLEDIIDLFVDDDDYDDI